MKSKTPRTDDWRERAEGESAMAYDRCETIELELSAALETIGTQREHILELASENRMLKKRVAKYQPYADAALAAMPNADIRRGDENPR